MRRRRGAEPRGRRQRELRLAIGLDERGVATVAWLTRTRHRHRFGTLRAAFGTATGRWSRPRVIARTAAEPRIAVAGGGDVLLAWTARRATVAWRAAGHGFGPPQRLRRPAVARGDGEVATPAFDAAGRAYLTADCDPAVALAAPHTRRFSTTAVLTGGTALGVRLVVTGDGDGLVSWTSGRCAAHPSGERLAPVQAAVVRGGAFGPPIAVGGERVDPLSLVAVPARGGGGTITWVEEDRLQSTVSPEGIAGPPLPVADPVPWLLDAGGDLALNDVEFVPAVTDLAIRPAGGGPDEPSPASNGALAVAPAGRVFAVISVRNGESAFRYATWRP